MTDLEKKYNEEIIPKIIKEFGIENINSVPRIEKIVVNAGIGTEFKSNSNAADEMAADLALITGQKPVITKSKLAIANFKLRENMPNGVMLTLRGDRMWNFLSKLINIALPRVKDFRGVPSNSFDPRGNYTLGIKEHSIFPEIDTTKSIKIRPFQVVIVTTSGSKDKSKFLLKELGMPFQKETKQNI